MFRSSKKEKKHEDPKEQEERAPKNGEAARVIKDAMRAVEESLDIKKAVKSTAMKITTNFAGPVRK